ncbi:hypothetical protein BDV93DRAFT_606800 [Ceratobasidium sp. AG-I]|nr:hypothetical protein BDV93DRAFT_606800 [Ceratobasidium sp. AG-I]
MSGFSGTIVSSDPIATLLEVHSGLQLAKIFNIVALTFLSWDIVITLGAEIEYIWKSRWNTIRVLYMIARYFSLVTIGTHSIILFHPTISLSRYAPDHGMPDGVVFMFDFSCNVALRVSVTLTVVGIASTMLLLLLRVWVMWDKSLWVLFPLLALYTGVQIIPVVLLVPRVYRMNAIENPLPGILTGCTTPFTAEFPWFRPLLCGLAYETTLFGLTVYQAWRSYKACTQIPLLTHLAKDGAVYFLVVVVTILLTLIGTTNTKTLPAAMNSGMFLGVTSSMCCRLVLRLRSYAYAISTLSLTGDDHSMTVFARPHSEIP